MTVDATELCALLNSERMLRELEQLVIINSHTRNVQGVERVGEQLQWLLAGTCLRVQERAVAGFAPHLCFSTPAADESAPILLIGHHDTVFPEGTFEGFRREGELALGPGVLDMKGGLCVIMEALRALDAAGLLESTPLRFLSVSDEEVGSPSSSSFTESLAANARAALVFEAGRSGDAIITARRGSGHARVLSRGRAAHAGNALAEGRNAIWALSRFIDRAQALNGTIDGASLNVGLIGGGTARNTVPEDAWCELDLRFSDSAGQQLLSDALLSAASSAAEELEGTRVTVSIHLSRKPWARNEGSAALSARFGRCQREAGLDYAEAKLIGGGSDANTVGALNVPTIDGLGPRGRGFHTHDEQIEISSLRMKAEALLRFLLQERAP